MEDLGLKIAILCLNSDFLDIKLQGVKSLSDFSKKVRMGELYDLNEDDLIKKFRAENVLNVILKGHSQLISKATQILRLMLTKDSYNNKDENSLKDLELIWNTIKKGDYETRTTLYKNLSDFTWELKKGQVEYLMSNIQTTKPDKITAEEIDFASKICYSVRHKFNPEDVSRIMSMACCVFWNAT